MKVFKLTWWLFVGLCAYLFLVGHFNVVQNAPGMAIFLGISIVLFRMFLMTGMLYANENGFDWHHEYTGSLLMFVGYYVPRAYSLSEFVIIVVSLLFMIGLWMKIDDWVQHRMQVKNKAYHSFWHNIGKPLYRFRMFLVKKFPFMKFLNYV